MFSKTSRYKKLPGVITIDAGGRSLESKGIRLLVEAPGTFLHTVEENDRLDHLAYKYYKQSSKWWRICDANPGFMSPLELLGKEPVVISYFPVSYAWEDKPPWHEVIKRISQTPGVLDVIFEENSQLVKETVALGEDQVEVNTEKFKRVLIVTHNHLNVTVEDLINVIENEDEQGNKQFQVVEPGSIARVGKQIIIPPNVVG